MFLNSVFQKDSGSCSLTHDEGYGPPKSFAIINITKYLLNSSPLIFYRRFAFFAYSDRIGRDPLPIRLILIVGPPSTVICLTRGRETCWHMRESPSYSTITMFKMVK